MYLDSIQGDLALAELHSRLNSLRVDLTVA